MMTTTTMVVGCRDAQRRPVILAFCQQPEVWSDERLVQQLSRLLLYHCTTCCSPALRYAGRPAARAINLVAHLRHQLRHRQCPCAACMRYGHYLFYGMT